MADLRIEPQPQTEDEANEKAQMANGDSFEYRLLETYIKKKELSYPQSNGTAEKKAASPTPSAEHHKTKKKKKKRFSVGKLISCIRPQKEDCSPVSEDPRHKPASGETGLDTEVNDVVNKLTKITDAVHFLPSDLETDGDDIADQIAELLKEQGDKLNEEIKKNHELMEKLQGILTYSFFKKLTRTFIQSVTPEEVPLAKDENQANIALICELTSRLRMMDHHPMNRVLGFGARYLQENYTSLVNQQGGYGKVFSSDDEDEVQ